MIGMLFGVLAAGLAQNAPPSGFVWQPPSSQADCTVRGGLGWERFTCSLPPGTTVGPKTQWQPQLGPRVQPIAEGSVVGDTTIPTLVYFSPSWNSWSSTGSGAIFGSIPSENTTFLLFQLRNSSGGYLDACPLSVWGETLVPKLPDASGGAPPSVPFAVNVSGLGYVPPVPAVELNLRESLIISDAAIVTRAGVPLTARDRALTFVEMYSQILPSLTPSQATSVADFEALATRSANDMLHRAPASVTIDGAFQLRAYLNDSRASSELVTQLDVLEALSRWNSTHALATTLRAPFASGSVSYFHEETACVGDALSQVKYGPGSLLDGWYVLFMVGKLVDLAHAGEGWAKSLVLRSVDRIIHLARGFGYSWPITYDALTGTAVTGEEASDVYGYLYIMMRVYSLTNNATFLNEAKAAHGSGNLHKLEFFSLYERPFLEWGSLGLLLLADATTSPDIAQEAVQTLAYTLPSIQLYQADHGYRSAVPTFMLIDAMRSTYSAAFETHQTLWYLHQVLSLSGTLPVVYQLPEAAATVARQVLRYGLGVSRHSYPDKLPSFVFAPQACPGGPGSCGTFSFDNDASVMVPVEDYWGSETHRGFSPWGPRGAAPHDTTILFGHIGQEIYGAGAAFDGALLTGTYQPLVAGFQADDVASSLQIHPRFQNVTAGGTAAFSVHPSLPVSAWSMVSVSVDSAIGVEATLGYDHAQQVGQVRLAVPKGHVGLTETVVWLVGVAGVTRPSRLLLSSAA